MSRDNLSSRSGLAWLVWGLLSGCSPHKQTTSVGVFEFADHMRRDPIRWDGGNAYLAYREICNRATGQCWQWDPGAQVGSFDLVSRSSRRVAIISIDGNGRGRSFEVLIFDSDNGVLVECDNCKKTAYQLGARLISANVQGDFFVIYIEVGGEHGRHFSFALDVRPGKYRMYEIFDIDLAQGARMIGAPVISPNGASAAWYECAEECRMITRTLDGEGRYAAKGIDCVFEPGGFIGVNWVEGRPQATCY